MNIRQRLMPDDEVAKILDALAPTGERSLSARLEGVSDSLSKAELEVYNVKMELSEVDNQIADMEAEALFEAQCAVGDDGKKLYTNDGQRKVAANKQLATDPEFVALLNRRKAIGRTKMAADQRVGKHFNMVKALKNEYYATMKRADIMCALSSEVSRAELESKINAYIAKEN